LTPFGPFLKELTFINERPEDWRLYGISQLLAANDQPAPRIFKARENPFVDV
jgi:hypothetical protein